VASEKKTSQPVAKATETAVAPDSEGSSATATLDPPKLPPPPSYVGGHASFLQMAEARLEETGWVRTGTNLRGQTKWADPAGSGSRRPELREALELPQKDGEPIKIRQTFGPPCAWDYVTEEAYWIQRQREESGHPTEHPQTRANRLGTSYDSLRRSVESEIVKAEPVLRRVLPEKAEGLRQEIMLLRSRVGEMLNVLKSAVAPATATVIGDLPSPE